MQAPVLPAYSSLYGISSPCHQPYYQFQTSLHASSLEDVPKRKEVVNGLGDGEPLMAVIG
jgi:hypothetical protein